MEINGQFYDIPYNDKDKINEYVNAFDIDNDVIDFDTIDNNKDVALNAENMNAIVSKTDDLQDFFIENVNNKLQEAETQFYSWVNNFQNYEEYIDGKTYNRNDRVLYTNDNGLTDIYLCLKDATEVSPVDALDDKWIRIFGTQGAKGKDGYNLNYRGAYDWQFEVYNKNDVVYADEFDKVFYVCLNNNVKYSKKTMPWDDPDNWIYLFMLSTVKFRVFNSSDAPTIEYLNTLIQDYVYGIITSESSYYGYCIVEFYIKKVGVDYIIPLSIVSESQNIYISPNRDVESYIEGFYSGV